MTALLLTWSPRGWPYEHLRRTMARFVTGRRVEPWRIQAHRQARPGQRAFVLRQGGVTGIVGSGTVVTTPHRDPAAPDGPMLVDVEFDRFVDPCQTVLLTREQVAGVLSPQQLRIQGSGTTLTDATAADLDRLLGETAPTDLVGQGDWTPAELRQAIARYLEALSADLDGRAQPANELVEQLQRELPRPAAEIRQRCRQISARLEDWGLPWLSAYRPLEARNAVLAVLLQEVLTESGWLTRHSTVPVPALPPLDDVFVDAPQLPLPPEPTKPGQNVSAPGDAAGREAANRALGRAGEAFVYKLEQERLRCAGRPDLALEVCWRADSDGDGLGFDIESRDLDGQPIWIEVKTTRDGIGSPFHLTANELRVSARHGASYRLYRVFDFGRSTRVYRVAGPLEDRLGLRPTVYLAAPR